MPISTVFGFGDCVCVCVCMRACGRTRAHVHAQLCLILATPKTEARQAPLSLEFSRQEYWNGLPSPPLEDLPNPRMELVDSCVDKWILHH